MSTAPIAVFDSGIGGLSVVRCLRRLLPAEDLIYFGDTARVPWGAKSPATVLHFSLEIARFLLQFDPKLIVVACNTASAVALPGLAAALPTPVVGVVEPGAAAAVKLAAGRPIAVMGTEATIASGSYPAAIRALTSAQHVLARACPLLVPLVEEGRDEHDPLVRMAVEQYLRPLRDDGARVVVLGCTHYPLLRGAIAEFLGPDTAIVDSGEETAAAVRARLVDERLLNATGRAGSLRCFVSDNVERFRRVGSRFLREPIADVALVSAEQYVGSAMELADG